MEFHELVLKRNRSKRHTLITANARCKQTAQLTAKRLRSGICICILLTCLKWVILWPIQIHNCRSLWLPKPYYQVFNKRFLALTIMQSVETYISFRNQNRHRNLTCIICDILWLTFILSEQARHDWFKKTKHSWKVEIADYWKCGFVKFCNQFNHNIVRFRPILSNTDTNSTSKHFFSINERCCFLAIGVDRY